MFITRTIFTLWLFSLPTFLLAASGSSSLEKMAGNMLMVGFHGTSAKAGSQICEDIRRYNLAGVILFDFNPVDKSKPKNIASKTQLKQLTGELQACSRDHKLLIAVDQEGGRVQRLKSKYGFYGKYPKAIDMLSLSYRGIRDTYSKMARELRSVGVNYDLAPVVDLAINPKNMVIYGLGRSFGSTPKEVVYCASIFVQNMRSEGIVTALKHFPGHGSSTGDTHKGFVDVTAQWKKSELIPYRTMIRQGRVDTVMVAHVFNKNIDASYPATLSQKTVNGLLRQKLGFQGAVITDDLQMGAISKKYGLKNTIKLAVNAGDDILLFGNQLDPNKTVSTKKLVDTMIALVKSGEIKLGAIKKANARVNKLKKRL
ncbi:MAG TPA: glycosyl hydrolase [Epsilonproteobacteria bacterium]|nr:glycosyl hydrolase [Campylobacterota bacterium]